MELISEVRRRMLDVSTVGGLRQMVSFPFLVAKNLLVPSMRRRKVSLSLEPTKTFMGK